MAQQQQKRKHGIRGRENEDERQRMRHEKDAALTRTMPLLGKERHKCMFSRHEARSILNT